MPRLSIDVTQQQHQKLKAMAALKGMSIKQYVLEQTIEGTPDVSSMTEDEAMAALQDTLRARAKQALAGQTTRVPPGGLVDHLKARARTSHG